MRSVIQYSSTLKIIINLAALCAIILSTGLAISYGSTEIELGTVWEAVFQFDPELSSHQIIQELRLPRALSAALVGAFLAVSGSIMQGMTRNPLASPSIMGVTDGAAFGLMMILAFFPSTSNLGLTLSSFIGAALAVSLIFMIGSSSGNGLTPVKLALAGVAIGTLLRSITSILSLHFQLEKEMGFWLAGGLDKTNWSSVQMLVIFGAIGLLFAFSIAKSMTVLSLGEDVSIGLGLNNAIIKIIGIVAVFMLTGVSVSVAGAIGFVGLIVPHITRFLMGADYRWIIPSSALFGSLLVILSDLVSRMINAPFETPVGAITSLIGVPFFLYLARSKGEKK
ncbi:FecCD family ABC transporter permease [Lederbergia galactosidilytica]|uniref:Ferrichrome ABC transporter permease n=1 Tax=Lederbergia galactosidilytica TaxID=217031 RepID=A0A177ZKK8_9BACI|nr:iron ABC transporter permease [Lederbergia galactosidilytica]KRG12572.1 ferrichrome ABC transporter permease [Virgibacillus soli]MBP1916036.1 iron complex transport system permease protein [Lederbergia galactosidilytica]OAK68482.1 ferrichrome ABC transporter permease [Lederbergia galactosidilytica]